MTPDQLLDERQSDSGSLLGPAALSLDAMEALEKSRQFVLGNADAGIPHRKLHHRFVPGELQRHRDLAVESVFEGIRYEVQDDLLPHVAVDMDRHR